MSKKFITTKELSLIDKLNRELIQNFVGQEITYYAISIDATDVHDIYGESIRKSWSTPVRFNGLVSYDQGKTSSTELGLDSTYTLEAYLHTQELVDRNVIPREGDFIEFGQKYFEVSSVTQPQMTYGQFNHLIMTKLSCVAAREGQFAAGGASNEFDDRTHPVQPSRPRSLGGS